MKFQNYSILMSVYYKETPDNLSMSIESMLNQTIKSDDFIIVCDGPLGDDLEEVITFYKKRYCDIIKIVRLEKNVGLGSALNEGIKHCKHELVARMDSDDISEKNRCEQQLNIFNQKNVDIVSGTLGEFNKDINDCFTLRVLPENHKDIVKYSKTRSPFNHACAMYKKQEVEKAGNYQDFYFFEDYYLWIRMLISGSQGYNIQEVIYYARAEEDLYERRGGVRYVKSIIKFRKWLFEIKYITFFQFLYTAVGHSLVALLPSRIRKEIYVNVLREKAM